MVDTAQTLVVKSYLNMHQNILAFAASLTSEQLYWQPAPGGLTIAFHLWHIARWAEHLRVSIPGMTPELRRRLPAVEQIWEQRGLARAWGFDRVEAGYASTGMGMDESDAAGLVFPAKEVFLAYASEALEAAGEMVSSVGDDQFLEPEQPQPVTEGVYRPGGSVGWAIQQYLLHDAYHFGSMSGLLGLYLAAGK